MNKPKKVTALAIITLLLLSTILTAQAVTPPTVTGHETYQTIEGVLDTDEYVPGVGMRVHETCFFTTPHGRTW